MIDFFSLLFWFFVFSIMLHYFFFPAVLLLLSHFKKATSHEKNLVPTVTIIVAAYNESSVIEEKIINDLKINYPSEKVNYLVVSDGSTDGTEKIVEKYKSLGVQSLFESQRLGKSAALNRAVRKAKSEILIFSDANTFFDRNAIYHLVKHFSRAEVGGVSGRKIIIKEQGREASVGDRLFWNIESLVKKAQSSLGSITTADGEIFAMRRSCYRDIPQSLINDDQFLTLSLVHAGWRVVYEYQALTFERASKTLGDDFNVKSRMVYGGLQMISYFKFLRNPFESWFSLQFFLHKTLRYFMWLNLVMILSLGAFNFGNNVFADFIFYMALIFSGLAAVAFSFDDRANLSKIFYLPYYYLLMNLAAFRGFVFFLKGTAQTEIWKKAER